MDDSILDKVLHSQEDQQIEQFSSVEIVQHSLRLLSVQKEAEVIRRRFGLDGDGKKDTLETIGANFSVTRERIRQIQNQAIKTIQQSAEFQAAIKPVRQLLGSVFEHRGGLMTQEMAFDVLLGDKRHLPIHRNALVFLLTYVLTDVVEPLPKNKTYRAGWKLKLTSLDFVDRAIDVLVILVKTIKEPHTLENLYRKFSQTDFFQEHATRLPEPVVESLLHTSNQLARNPFDEYGLAKWGSIQPKRMHDRVYLVLKKQGEPMHFEDIAVSIQNVFERKAYPPTVHNELILNNEYVLVGRGIYALREWGYSDGVVADVLATILQDYPEGLTRDELIKAVLAQRIVKKNTIVLALSDKTKFTKHAGGKYTVTQDAVSLDA